VFVRERCGAICGGACTDLQTDANNCGACGSACPCGQACVGGICQAPALSTGLLAHFRFDEGSGTTTTDDTSGNVGTLLNGPVWSAGVFGGALTFDGVDDQVSVPSSASLQPTTAFTASVWFKMNSYPTDWGGLFCKGPDAFDVCDYGAALDGAGNMWRSVKLDDGASGTEAFVLGTKPVALGQWHHLAMVFDGNTLRAYLDGEFDGSSLAAQSPTLPLSTSASPLHIGMYDPQSFFPGQIDDLSIWSRALTQDEVQQLYSSTCVHR
jgi:hypothetical protein